MTRLDGIKILAVDDVEDALLMLSTLLSRAGADVDVAATAAAAIAKAKSGGYDAILMDIHLPDMPGTEAVEALRRGGYTGAVLGYSACAFASDREEALRRGCDGYVTKPASLGELTAAIEDALIGRGPVVQSHVPEVPWLPSNSAPPAKA